MHVADGVQVMQVGETESLQIRGPMLDGDSCGHTQPVIITFTAGSTSLARPDQLSRFCIDAWEELFSTM